MGKGRIPLKGGLEYDALTNARGFYGWRAGTVKWVKRHYNKRVRRTGKQEAKRDFEQS